jgi:hypothetical protein
MKETQIKSYKVIALPICLYGRETWFLREDHRRSLQIAEIRFLKAMAGFRLTNFKGWN